MLIKDSLQFESILGVPEVLVMPNRMFHCCCYQLHTPEPHKKQLLNVLLISEVICHVGWGSDI